MPEYSFKCNKCESSFSKLFGVSEYEIKIKKTKCPFCKSSRIYRDFFEDNITTNYIKGVHEATTLGELADKQTKKLGKNKAASLKAKMKTKTKNTLEERLPEGMSISKYEDTGRLSKKEINKKRGKNEWIHYKFKQ